MPAPLIVKPGTPFGALRAVAEASRAPDGARRILCHCPVCGKEKAIRLWCLRNRNLKDCGCSKASHGYSRKGLPEYAAWVHMHQRCSNPEDQRYHRYGGRGIKVCERWNDFKAFLADVGRRPSPQHSLDRFPDNNGNYEPGNVRWATPAEQGRNQERTWRVRYKGEEKPLTEWAEQFGLKYATLQHRLIRGWSVERALTTPAQQRGVSHEALPKSRTGRDVAL